VESKLDIKAIEEEMNKLIELLYHEHNKISLHIIKKKKIKRGRRQRTKSSQGRDTKQVIN
jgi:hypothetical protein